jgi:hypothetical protein
MYGLKNSTPNTVTEMKLKNLDESGNLKGKGDKKRDR